MEKRMAHAKHLLCGQILKTKKLHIYRNMTDFLELCRERFSVRKYTDEPVSQSDLDYVLEAVRMAPSACNKQPWKFVVVETEEARKRLHTCYSRDWFMTAPLYIICLKSADKGWVRADDGKAHADIDLAIATEHLCLAAADRGLGTCWVCNYDVKRMDEEFRFPGFEPVAIIPIGHVAPDCMRPEKNRLPLKEITEHI